jgi:tetratricopeptide (TPR) repeat protein
LIDFQNSHLEAKHEAIRDNRYSDVIRLFNESNYDLQNDSEFYYTIGTISHSLNNFHLAERLCLIAIIIKPDESKYYSAQTVMLNLNGENEKALSVVQHSLYLNPHNFIAHYNASKVFFALDRQKETLLSLYHSYILSPDYAPLLLDIKQFLALHQRHFQARIMCRRAVILNPHQDVIHLHYGCLLGDSGQLAEANHAWQLVLILTPAHSSALNNYGNTLRFGGDLEKAKIAFDRALILDSSVAEIRASRSLVLLGLGYYQEGWKEYFHRWNTPSLKNARRNFESPQWRGENGHGRLLLLHGEQGFGDSLQFCRYVSMAAERGWIVILDVLPELVTLMSSLSGVSKVISHYDSCPASDAHSALMDLPAIFDTTIETIPRSEAYLFPDIRLKEVWRDKLSQKYGHKPKIGIAWAGNPRTGEIQFESSDKRRSIPLENLRPLFDHQDYLFFSLQKNKIDMTGYEDYPLISVMDDIHDFAESAAFISQLDLVITVDSAVAHLASAIGKPVWMMDRLSHCWRWERFQSQTSWYPHMTIFRQKNSGIWDDVIHAIRKNLRITFQKRDLGPQFHKSILVTSPHQALGYHLLADKAKESQQESLAQELWSRALVLHQDIIVYRLSLSHLLKKQNNHQGALVQLSYANIIKPDDAEISNRLSLIYFDLGQFHLSRQWSLRTFHLSRLLS